MTFLRRRRGKLAPQKPWTPLLAHLPLPRQVVTLPATNPITQQV